MNLVDVLLNKKIAGLQEPQYHAILNGLGKPGVSSVTHGVIVLENGHTIRCVANYYKQKGGSPTRFESGATSCHFVRTNLQVEHAETFNCLSCHLDCWYGYQQGRLEKIRKRRKKKSMS